jgi:hypothetical protein
MEWTRPENKKEVYTANVIQDSIYIHIRGAFIIRSSVKLLALHKREDIHSREVTLLEV